MGKGKGGTCDKAQKVGKMPPILFLFQNKTNLVVKNIKMSL